MQEKTLNLNGLELAYLDSAPESNKPILLLVHGWLDNAASFTELMAELNDYRCLALDLPGHGYSDHLPPYASYHFIDGVTLILQFLEALNLNNVTMIGHSLGGCMASILAGGAPEKISKLILLDALGPLTAPPELAAEKYQDFLKNQKVQKRKGTRQYETLEQACQHRAANGYLSADLLGPIVQRGTQQIGEHYQWRHDPKLLLPSPIRMTQTQVVSFLQRVTAPTLLILAKQGFKFDEQMYHARADAVQDIKVQTLECGHHLHIEQPKTCGQLIKDFLAE